MMESYLFAGLGNIGAEYVQTRHNIGFAVVEYLAHQKEAEWDSGRHALHCQIKIKGRTVTLIKPTTYMNLSGKAIQYWLDKTGVSRDRIMVITDDLSLPLGKLRIRASGSAGGHNGLSDIISTLGNDQWPRLRFGIGNDFPKGRQVDFVLGQWKKEEEPTVAEGIIKSVSALESFIMIGLTRTMEQYNR